MSDSKSIRLRFCSRIAASESVAQRLWSLLIKPGEPVWFRVVASRRPERAKFNSRGQRPRKRVMNSTALKGPRHIQRRHATCIAGLWVKDDEPYEHTPCRDRRLDLRRRAFRAVAHRFGRLLQHPIGQRHSAAEQDLQSPLALRRKRLVRRVASADECVGRRRRAEDADRHGRRASGSRRAHGRDFRLSSGLRSYPRCVRSQEPGGREGRAPRFTGRKA